MRGGRFVGRFRGIVGGNCVLQLRFGGPGRVGLFRVARGVVGPLEFELEFGFLPVDLDLQLPVQLTGDTDLEGVAIGAEFDLGALRERERNVRLWSE